MAADNASQDRSVKSAPYERLERLLASDVYDRMRTLLVGGPGITITIDPNEQPLLFEMRLVVMALDRAAEDIFTNYRLRVIGRERVQRMIRCTHEHQTGGNDYMECLDCGITWDWRHETADQAVRNYVNPS